MIGHILFDYIIVPYRRTWCKTAGKSCIVDIIIIDIRFQTLPGIFIFEFKVEINDQGLGKKCPFGILNCSNEYVFI